MKRWKNIAVMLVLSLAIAACDTAEDRADRLFQQAVRLRDQGDITAAREALADVLELTPNRVDAYALLGDIARQNENLPQALGMYRKVLEYTPNDGEVALALCDIALTLGAWEMVRRYLPIAEEQLGDQPEVLAIGYNMEYRDMLFKGTPGERLTVIEEARALLEAHPDLINARRMIIDDHLRKQEFDQALDLVTVGISITPLNYEFYQIRIGILEELNARNEITLQLETMLDIFPDETAIPNTLARWYVAEGLYDRAETLLRNRAEEMPENLQRQTDLIRFMNENRGYEAVVAELERLRAEGGENLVAFSGMHAGLLFENGETERAMMLLREIIETMPNEDRSELTRNEFRIDLARMLAQTGDVDQAKEITEDVLRDDPGQVSGIKLKAAWLIDEEKVEAGVDLLRQGLRESPRDSQLMTLMALGHERAGDWELQREMLSLAVEASRGASAESLRYAAVLMEEERYNPAEAVIINAWRQNRGDINLLHQLGKIYVFLANWEGAQEVLNLLDEIARNGPVSLKEDAQNALISIQAYVLDGQKRDEELFNFLEELSNTGTGLNADVAIIRAYTVRGETIKARERLFQAMSKDPDNVLLRFLDASIKTIDGQFAEAEQDLEALLLDIPDAEQVWMTLYRLHLLRDDPEKARAVLDRALKQLPDGSTVLFALASERESQGRIDEAISIYRQIYESNRSVEVIANNLASLLSQYRDDEQSLQEAYLIGRRLRNSKIPAFRDTYGWIMVRMGNFEEAESHLEIALGTYPDNAVVQYHYAVMLDGLGRAAEALTHFRIAQDIGLPDERQALVVERIAALEALGITPVAVQ